MTVLKQRGAKREKAPEFQAWGAEENAALGKEVQVGGRRREADPNTEERGYERSSLP